MPIEFVLADVPTFEREFQQAPSEVAASYDTRVLDEVIDRWWRIAVLRSVILSEAEQDQLSRARAGDFTGLLEQTADGSFRLRGCFAERPANGGLGSPLHCGGRPRSRPQRRQAIWQKRRREGRTGRRLRSGSDRGRFRGAGRGSVELLVAR